MTPEIFLKSVNERYKNGYDCYSFMKQNTTDIHNFSFYIDTDYFKNEDISIYFITDNIPRKHSLII